MQMSDRNVSQLLLDRYCNAISVVMRLLQLDLELSATSKSYLDTAEDVALVV